MPLNPPPTIEIGLGLVVQALLRSDMSRAAEVTFALNVAGVPSPAVAQDAIDDFQTNFVAAIGPVLDSQVTIEQPTIKLGDGSTVPFEAIGAAPVSVGGAAGTKLPPNVALLVKKRTGVGGRKNHGRTYFPFVLEDPQVNENGTLVPASQAALDLQMGAFLSQLSLDTTPMCIPNKTFNVPLAPHFVTALHTGPLVTSFVCESLIATQRRRLGR